MSKESKLEQAAKEYANNGSYQEWLKLPQNKSLGFTEGVFSKTMRNFIAGAKSEAAKEYWQSLTTPASNEVEEGQTQEPAGIDVEAEAKKYAGIKVPLRAKDYGAATKRVYEAFKAGYAASLPQSSTDIKGLVIKHLLSNESELDKPYMACGGKTYTKKELAMEIKYESKVGMKIIENILALCLDMLSRGKTQSSTEEEKDLWGETISFFLEACAANVGDKIHEKVVTELQSKFKISKR